MTIVFVNGGGPTYPGSTFTTGTELLTLLHDTLVSAGWSSITNTPGANLIELEGFSGTHSCYLQAYITSDQLVLRGAHTNSFTVLSPELLPFFSDSLVDFNCRFTSGTTNYCWIAADADCFCIMVRDSADVAGYGAQRFGFYDRYDSEDEWAWGVGPLYTFPYAQFVAKRALNATNWWDAGLHTTFFNKNAPFFNERDIGMPIEGYISVYTQCNRNTASADGASINAGQKRHYGNNNGATLSAQPSFHYILEGEQDAPHSVLYGQQGFRGFSFFYRGTVKFAATGMAHLPAGTTITLGANTYISPGPLGIGFQIA